MDLMIDGLRVLVTAGANGIGMAIAEAFAGEGARVHVCDIDKQALQALAARRPEIGTSFCDVSDRDSVAALFEEVSSHLGGLDCLVNNAGIAGPTARVGEIDPGDWERTLAVNITGQFNCVRLAVPHLARSGNGSICNLSSAAGRLGFGLRTPYAASKWAVVGFTKSLSIELAELGIRANAILPGIVEGERQDRVLTEKARASGRTLDEMKREALARASVKEMVTPRQLADAILFLASPRSRTTSGQAVSVCGDLQMLS
ncbi:SDR family oxidoreductase [Manganibacter manganicus]|uniref:3-oxoacyl-[acyl-carrier-protein] reductase n=1 Tax=Manganibacter manganicus TaxID=1873176 RepID=A0A1V8RSE0_9HYPH|nr:SDR family oxidoreductase [Pseudaminobacter manganicus]OQM76063.1 3-oxoacyl-[acyl-carrier-protein] reductase [Pseudaminobacter manganicus]